MSGPTRILLTRARPDAKRTAARLAEHGFQAVIAPVIRIVPTPFEAPPGPFAAVIVTSANAARALRSLDAPGTPVFAVGRQTAIAVRKAGIETVHEAEGDAAALADLVRRASLAPGSRLLRLAGRDRKVEPDASLAAAGFAVAMLEVYEAAAEPDLPTVARDALKEEKLRGAMHFSRRSAEILIGLVEKADLLQSFRQLTHVCLSPDVAEPLRALDAGRILVAERPHQGAMLAALSAALSAT